MSHQNSTKFFGETQQTYSTFIYISKYKLGANAIYFLKGQTGTHCPIK